MNKQPGGANLAGLFCFMSGRTKPVPPESSTPEPAMAAENKPAIPLTITVTIPGTEYAATVTSQSISDPVLVKAYNRARLIADVQLLAPGGECREEYRDWLTARDVLSRVSPAHKGKRECAERDERCAREALEAALNKAVGESLVA